MIRRQILPQLRNHLNKKEMTMICGPRQVGKTTLMNVLIDELQGSGEPVLFLSYDIESDQPFLMTQRALTDKIKLEFGNRRGYVFIDEIQRKEDAGLFLKGLYDMNLPCKFIVTGSGSLELKEKIAESMAGRKRIFELAPLSFTEFVDYRRGDSYPMNPSESPDITNPELINLFNEYMNFGGYPRVVTAATIHEKRQVINEIYQSYIDRDIRVFLSGERPESFSRLMKLLAAHSGRMLNLNNLSNDIQLTVSTIRKYLWYAEKTFFIRLVSPYINNVTKEITKSPVVYFYDQGMRNLALSCFGNLQSSVDQGFVFQNIVGNLLLQELGLSEFSVKFWRTTDKAEVDFVIDRGNNPIAVEVKLSSMKKPQITRSLRSFIDKYHPSDAWVVNLSLDDKLILGKTKIRFIPFFRFHSAVQNLFDSIESDYQVSERKFVYKFTRKVRSSKEINKSKKK